MLQIDKSIRYSLTVTRREKRGLNCIIDEAPTHGAWIPKGRLSREEWRSVQVGDKLWSYLFINTHAEGCWIRASHGVKLVPNQHCH